LCAHEIARLEKSCGSGIQFKDIHALNDEAVDQEAHQYPSKQAMLERLHCLTQDKGWLIGAEANLRAWSHTSLKHWIKPLSWPGIFQLLKLFYEIWLVYYRFQRQRRLDCEACQRDK
jgi:hypothetical protein